MGFFDNLRQGIGKVRDFGRMAIGKVKEVARHGIGKLQMIHHKIGNAAVNAHEAIRAVPIVGQEAYDTINASLKNPDGIGNKVRYAYNQAGHKLRELDNNLYDG